MYTVALRYVIPFFLTEKKKEKENDESENGGENGGDARYSQVSITIMERERNTQKRHGREWVRLLNLSRFVMLSRPEHLPFPAVDSTRCRLHINIYSAYMWKLSLLKKRTLRLRSKVYVTCRMYHGAKHDSRTTAIDVVVMSDKKGIWKCPIGTQHSTDGGGIFLFFLKINSGLMILTRFSSAPITKYAENVLVVPLVVLILLFFFCSFRFRSASVGGCVCGEVTPLYSVF